MKNKIILITIFSLLLFACSENQSKKKIEVFGNGFIKYTPQYIYVSFTIQTINIDPKISQTENTKINEDLINVLHKHNIPDTNIVINDYTIKAEYENNESKKILKGYQTENTIKIKYYNIKNYNLLILDVLKTGVKDIGDMEFGSDNLEDLRNKALIRAIENAKSKVNEISKKLNVTIGQIIDIVESNERFNYVEEEYYSRWSLKEEKSIGTTISYGERKMDVTVKVVFELK